MDPIEGAHACTNTDCMDAVRAQTAVFSTDGALSQPLSLSAEGHETPGGKLWDQITGLRLRHPIGEQYEPGSKLDLLPHSPS